MFTGIIQGIGKVQSIENKGNEFRIKISPENKIDDYEKGESIAVNGVCLTVENYSTNFFEAYASAETLSKTNLGNLKNNSLVNLERALALGDRLGGHLVSGHVDDLAEVVFVEKKGLSFKCRFSFNKKHAPYIVEKGSICIDGISLTVNNCGYDFFEVNIIPETMQETTAKNWKSGYKVNIETDIIGKYIINGMLKRQNINNEREGITLDFLAQNGF